MLDTGMSKDCIKSSSCWGFRFCRVEGYIYLAIIVYRVGFVGSC